MKESFSGWLRRNQFLALTLAAFITFAFQRLCQNVHEDLIEPIFHNATHPETKHKKKRQASTRGAASSKHQSVLDLCNANVIIMENAIVSGRMLNNPHPTQRINIIQARKRNRPLWSRYACCIY